ncbi:hypothetical protein REH65_32415 [Saccharopolyspora sp. ID03-671]|uniref:hypothetical protein n=1 Tax=Saccharopolyspora sp. ID03-671 TaxID=3073066 RepID=UPI00324631D2
MSEEEESELSGVNNEHLATLTFDAIIDRDTDQLDVLQAEWFRRAEYSRRLGQLARDHRTPRE